MIVFIDESGDSGFKKSSSPFFVLTMVVISSEEEMVRIANKIQQLKDVYNVYPEYKFAKTSDFHKEHFFNGIKNCNFDVFAIVVKKKNIYSSELTSNAKKFYNFFLKQLLQHSPLQEAAKIRIDSSSGKIFQREATNYLHKQLKNLKLQIKFIDSKKDNLIQLADMLCGAINRHYMYGREKSQWLAKVKQRIKDIWEFQ